MVAPSATFRMTQSVLISAIEFSSQLSVVSRPLSVVSRQLSVRKAALGAGRGNTKRQSAGNSSLIIYNLYFTIGVAPAPATYHLPFDAPADSSRSRETACPVISSTGSPPAID